MLEFKLPRHACGFTLPDAECTRYAGQKEKSRRAANVC